MTLHDIGFENSEIETYIRLQIAGGKTEAEHIRTLNRKRIATLDEIHWKEKQLDRLNYLRHEIKKANNKNNNERTE
jgi:hypothetical protein